MANTFSSLFDLVYPEGSYYLSRKPTNHGSLFGGDWTQLANGKMLRSGIDNTTGGNDAHSHAYGALTTSYYGSMVNHTTDISFILANPPAVNVGNGSDIYGGTMQGKTHDRWGNKNDALMASATGLDKTFTGYYMLASTGRNIPNKPIVDILDGGTSITTDTGVLEYGETLENSTPIIPAYQSCYIFYRNTTS